MRPINHAVPGALMLLMRAAPLSAGKVGFAWRAAVGSAMERVTSVRLDGHVLRVDVADSRWAPEIRRSAPVILARLQNLLGEGAVTRIEVTARAS